MEKNTENSRDSLLINHEPAIFVDVDGTLWPDKGPGSIFHEIDLRALSSQLQDLCNSASIHRVFAVSNQTCVARGLCTLEQLRVRVSHIEDNIRSYGVKFDFRYCIHHPQATNIEYRIECDCRKPSPQMVIDISREFSIDLNRSIFIGDRITDAQSASRAGIKQIFLIYNEKMFEPNINQTDEKYTFKLVNFRLIPSIPLLAKYIQNYGMKSF